MYLQNITFIRAHFIKQMSIYLEKLFLSVLYKYLY